ANPEHPVLRTPRRRPTPWPRDTRNVLTRLAADSVREIAIVSEGSVEVEPFYALHGQCRRQSCTASSITSNRPSFSVGTLWVFAQSVGVPGCKASRRRPCSCVVIHAATARVWGHPYASKRASFTTSSATSK